MEADSLVPTHPVTFGPYVLDPDAQQLWRDGAPIPLAPKVWQLLCVLVAHPQQLVSKEDLFRAVWGETIVGEAALTTCVQELRRALGDDAKQPHYIETVHRRGYRFIAPLTPAPPVPSSTFQVSRSKDDTGQAQPGTGNVKLETPLVGRDAELTHLHRLLEKAIDGARQIVFVTGEAGIGKTALLEAFVARVQDQDERQKAKVKAQKHALSVVEGSKITAPRPLAPDPWFAHGQCIEQFGAGEAYLPLLSALGQLGREKRHERLVEVLQQYAPTWLVQMPALVPPMELDLLLRKTAGATRERMLREMAEALEALTAEQPLVLVLDDLHWSDPSTLELLSFLARRRQPVQLLVIGTYRPVEILADGHPLKRTLQELFAHHLATELALRLLTEAEVSTYLHQRFPASLLPTQLSRVLYQRTGGNPLFLTSLVRDLIARQVLTQFEEQWVIQSDIEQIATETPDSIRHLIARQRERLRPTEQRLLEAASVAGSEFSTAIVAAAMETPTHTIEEQCHRLTEQQQFLRPVGISTWADGTQAERYGFQHALYQELWHERVSLTQRQQWHLRMGERLEVAYTRDPHAVAAELARHFEQGGDYAKAIRYLQLAGEQSVRRSAHHEAANYLTKGLELLQTLPDNPERTQQELALQLALGAPLMNTKGFASPDVERTYTRAQALCRRVDETDQLFPALWGQWVFYFIRGDLRTARELGTQLLKFAQRTQDPTLLLQAHHGLWPALFFIGDWTPTRVHLEQGMALYDAQQHSSLAFLYSGHDAGVCCQGYVAWTLWFLGYPDQALQKSHETLALARESAYPSNIVDALISATWFYPCRRETQAAQEHADTVIALAREQGFALNLAFGTIVRGWALVEQGRGEEGITQMRQGLADSLATGAAVNRTYFLALLAGAYGTVGQPEEGLQVLAEALATVDKNDEHFYEAELYRLKGELTLAGVRGWGLGVGEEEKQKAIKKRQKTKIHSNPQPLTSNPEAAVEQEAEEYFLKAIEIAKKQQAKSLELRAVMSLVRLRQQQALGQRTKSKEVRARNEEQASHTMQHEPRTKLAEAHQMLSKIYGWFTEGFDTKDLQEAKALLKQLS